MRWRGRDSTEPALSRRGAEPDRRGAAVRQTQANRAIVAAAMPGAVPGSQEN